MKNKEVNPMRFIKCFVVFGLCLLMGSCPVGPEIDIGDYEYHLEEWNKQNMLDYKLMLKRSDYGGGPTIKQVVTAVITVRNGIPESSDPLEWLESGKMSTVPKFFSFIKKEEKRLKDDHSFSTLIAKYNTEYHYPMVIRNDTMWTGSNDAYPIWIWRITLTPLEENEQGNGEE
jgi:disulfide oxidoreductase YuzD